MKIPFRAPKFRFVFVLFFNFFTLSFFSEAKGTETKNISLMIPDNPTVNCLDHVLNFEDKKAINEIFLSLWKQKEILSLYNSQRAQDDGSAWIYGAKYDFERDFFKENHPAYSTAAKAILYSYKAPGLNVSILHGPYEEHTVNVENLRIHYDPEKTGNSSYLRFIFGSKPLDLTMNSADLIGETVYSKAVQLNHTKTTFKGEALYIRLKPLPHSVDSVSGPTLFIVRETGQFAIVPSGHPQMILDFFRSTYAKWIKPKNQPAMGKWRAYTWEE